MKAGLTRVVAFVVVLGVASVIIPTVALRKFVSNLSPVAVREEQNQQHKKQRSTRHEELNEKRNESELAGKYTLFESLLSPNVEREPHTNVCCESNVNHTVCCRRTADRYLARVNLCHQIRSSPDAQCQDVIRKDDYGEESPEYKEINGRGRDRNMQALILHENNDPTSPGTVYTCLRNDRIGSVILDVLQARSMAFQHNYNFGGVCKLPRPTKGSRVPYTSEKEIESYGLSRVVPFACPPGINRNSRTQAVWRPQALFPIELGLTANSIYAGENVSFLGWDMGFKAYIASLADISWDDQEGSSRSYTIAVHIRRGDVRRCKHPDRFLPNSYYLSLIDKYVQRYQGNSVGRNSSLAPLRVVIFSESLAEEPLDVFLKRGYELRIDEPLNQTWFGMMDSDVFIMSRSSFSAIPALLQRPGGIAVYTKFRFDWTSEDMKNWHRVDSNSSLWRRTEQEINAPCPAQDATKSQRKVASQNTAPR